MRLLCVFPILNAKSQSFSHKRSSDFTGFPTLEMTDMQGIERDETGAQGSGREMLEHAHNPEVVGSSPSPATMLQATFPEPIWLAENVAFPYISSNFKQNTQVAAHSVAAHFINRGDLNP